MGLSMGGATALSQAATDPRIEAVIADCAFDTMHNAVASRSAKATFDVGPFKDVRIPFIQQAAQGVLEAAEAMNGLPRGALSEADPLRAMPKLQDRPIFLIHGQEDDDTLPGNSVNLAKANPNAQLWLVPGAKHGESYNVAKTEYQTRVLEFLRRSF